jgi:hypothetical protein
MPVARAIHLWLARLRTGVCAWLEEVRFRTGVLVLAGSAAIAGCATVVAIVAAQGGSPAAVHRPLADQARPAARPLPVRPPRPAARPPQPRQAAPAAHRAGSASQAGNTTNIASYIASSGPRPHHRWRRGLWARGHSDHLIGRGWWHHGHSQWHGHSPWHHGQSRWHYRGGPHPQGRHRPGHDHW